MLFFVTCFPSTRRLRQLFARVIGIRVIIFNKSKDGNSDQGEA